MILTKLFLTIQSKIGYYIHEERYSGSKKPLSFRTNNLRRKTMKSTSKRRISLLLACVMLLGVMLVGCGGNKQESAAPAPAPEAAVTPEAVAPTTKSDETLIVAIGAEPSSVSPLASATGGLSSDCGGTTAMGTLLKMNAETRGVEPAMASYEMVDETHYRFTLVDGASFSDGTPVTSEDVRFCLQCYCDVGNANTMYLDMSGFEIIDDKTFIIALKGYTTGWDYDLADGLPIYSKASVESIGLDNTLVTAPIGSAQYNVIEWKSGEYMLLERNEHYWDPDWVGYYKYIKFIFIPDGASRLLAVQSGDAHIAEGVATSDVISLQANPDVDAYSWDSGVSYNLYFNCLESEACSNAKVREALCYAIDAEAVNMAMNLGTGKVVQGWVGENFPNYKEYYEGGHPGYDPEKAKALLAEAGYADGLELTLACMAQMKDVATIIQESLRQVGVTLNVEVCEGQTMNQRSRSGEYDITVWRTAQIVVSSQTFNIIAPDKMGVAGYHTRFNADGLAESIAKIMNSPDPAAQAEGFDEVCHYVFDNYTILGLCNGDKHIAHTAGLGGFELSTRMGFLNLSNVCPQ